MKVYKNKKGITNKFVIEIGQLMPSKQEYIYARRSQSCIYLL